MAFNKKQALSDNIAAIRLLFELDKSKREATPDERATLQKYSGFGALKCILNPADSLADITKWSKSELDLFAPTVQLHGLIKSNTTPEEYKQYMGSLKNSILTAFYTPDKVIDSVAKALIPILSHLYKPFDPIDVETCYAKDAELEGIDEDELRANVIKEIKRIIAEGYGI